MSSAATSRWLPRAPWAALVVVPAALLAAVSATGRPGPAGLVLAVLLLVALGLLLGWRTTDGQPERDMWRRLLLSGGLLGAGVLGTVACALVPGWEQVGGLPLAVATGLTLPAAYSGLLKWNRYPTSAIGNLASTTSVARSPRYRIGAYSRRSWRPPRPWSAWGRSGA